MPTPDFEATADLYDNGSKILMLKREDFIDNTQEAHKIGYNQAVDDCAESATVKRLNTSIAFVRSTQYFIYEVNKLSILKNKIE